jgi:hypothetical protein
MEKEALKLEEERKMEAARQWKEGGGNDGNEENEEPEQEARPW